MKEQLSRIMPYKPGKPIEEVKRELGLTEVIKLASNENPFGSSPKALEGMKQALESVWLYPDGYAAELRTALAELHQVDEESLIFGNGSDELVHLISRCVLQPGMNTVMATPTFPNYKRNAMIDGAEVREVHLKNGHHDLDQMHSEIDEKTGVVWLCNPNNPSGEYIREHELSHFLENVPASVLVVCDEAYFEYVTAEDYPDSIRLADRYPNLFVTRTFSKAYGLAGIRIGYGIGNRELIQSLEPAREPFNASRIAQTGALLALSDTEFLEESVRKNKEGLEQYYDFCVAHGLHYYPSQGNFILIDFGVSGDIVFDYLLRKGFIVRSGMALGFPNAVRITVGTQEQNSDLILHLNDFLSRSKQDL